MHSGGYIVYVCHAMQQANMVAICYVNQVRIAFIDIDSNKGNCLNCTLSYTRILLLLLCICGRELTRSTKCNKKHFYQIYKNSVPMYICFKTKSIIYVNYQMQMLIHLRSYLVRLYFNGNIQMFTFTMFKSIGPMAHCLAFVAMPQPNNSMTI